MRWLKLFKCIYEEWQLHRNWSFLSKVWTLVFNKTLFNQLTGQLTRGKLKVVFPVQWLHPKSLTIWRGLWLLAVPIEGHLTIKVYLVIPDLMDRSIVSFKADREGSCSSFKVTRRNWLLFLICSFRALQKNTSNRHAVFFYTSISWELLLRLRVLRIFSIDAHRIQLVFCTPKLIHF